MLVFNFTEAAAKHLCPEYRKGKELGFFEPSTTETVEQAFVSSESKKKMVFCVHVFKIGHYHNVVVVEYGTRWAHVIHKVKKGDLLTWQINRAYWIICLYENRCSQTQPPRTA